ncbi:hypothetical protein [uncultured Erythrobacter sp.]|uniref:hypothetical protein n=1 Tax=uncultured Erythrobacter sp. TaxID=263913 RepID=UPI0026229571|nr:hypothetical protein [uncultured Erythrobacter sp.]
MLNLRVGAAIAALTFAPFWTSPALADDQPLAAVPSSQWHAALEDGLCHLVRTFRAGDAEIQFILRRRAPGYNFELNVVSDTLDRRNRTPHTQYGLGTEPLRHGYSFRLKDGDWEGFGANIPADYFDNPVEQSLVITDAFEEDFALDLQNINSALMVMDQCLDEVLRSWGLDPIQQRALSKMAVPNERSGEILSGLTMRTSRVRDRLDQDSIYFIAMVDGEGIATSCRAEGEANEYDDVQDACREILQHARFEPALDADGEPVESFVIIETWIYTYTQHIFL